MGKSHPRIARDRAYLAVCHYGYDRGDERQLVSGARVARERSYYDAAEAKLYNPYPSDRFQLDDHTFPEYRTVASGAEAARYVVVNNRIAYPLEVA